MEDIIIRDSIFQDCDMFYKWETSPSVTEFFSIKDNLTYEELIREYVLNDVDDTKRQYTILKGNTIIGRIYLANINHDLDSLEIYRIYIGDRDLRNRGYGKKALLWILHKVFIENSFNRVYLDYYTGNPAWHLYKKIGFVHEGVARQACKKMDRYYDTHIMSMLKEDYERIYLK